MKNSTIKNQLQSIITFIQTQIRASSPNHKCNTLWGGEGLPLAFLGSAPVLIERSSCHLKTGLLLGEDAYMSEFQMLKTNLTYLKTI